MIAIILTIATIITALNITWFIKEYNRAIPDNYPYYRKRAKELSWWNIVSIAIQALIILAIIIILA